jgi:hypothetical protein
MKKTAFAIIVLAFLFVWHLVVCHTMENENCVIDPVTDIATVKMPGAAAYGITDPDTVAGFNGGRNLTGVPNAEHYLNLGARKNLDLYAMIVSYRVTIIDK